MSSVITVHMVDPAGKHTITAFADVSIESSADSQTLGSLGVGRPLLLDRTFEIRGADGYELHKGGTAEEAYMSVIKSLSDQLEAAKKKTRELRAAHSAIEDDMARMRHDIRVAIGDIEEEPEDECDCWCGDSCEED